MTSGMLEGKRALVAGVANKRSIAWAIAQALHDAGAELAFTYQGERLQGGVEKLAAEVGSETVVECDVSDDASIDRAFEQVADAGGLDIMVHSIAYAPQQALHGAGAELAFTYQGERLQGGVEKLAAEVGSSTVVECDVSDDASIDRAFSGVADAGGLDILVHSIAYAPQETFSERYIDTSREAFRVAHDISAYSLIAMAKRAEPLMAERGGGAMVTMTYMASERAFPGYNIMASAKAALECAVRYLAWELGPSGIRVNAVSAGPVRTLASAGIAGFKEMEGIIEQRTPLRKNIQATDAGKAALYLCSPMSEMVTGTVLYVDSGYHAMGI